MRAAAGTAGVSVCIVGHFERSNTTLRDASARVGERRRGCRGDPSEVPAARRKMPIFVLRILHSEGR